MNSTITSFKRFDLKKYSPVFTNLCFEIDAVQNRVSNIKIITDDYSISLDNYSLSYSRNYDYNIILHTWEFFELEPTSTKYKEYTISKDLLMTSTCRLPENHFEFRAIHFYRSEKEKSAFALLHRNKHCIMVEETTGKKRTKPDAKIMKYVIT